jgi:hypothetical protein
MDVIGDRHYRGAPGEVITLSVSGQNQVGAITVTGGGGAGLPCNVACGQHASVAVTVGFTEGSGGSADITISGSMGGTDTSKIRQITGLGFRAVLFVID